VTVELWLMLVFWVSVAGVVYPYAGYPLALMAFGRRRSSPPVSNDEQSPAVSLLIPVHNEEPRIAAKVTNTAALDYPAGRLEVIYISDGSTDGTIDIIRSQAPSATVIELATRGGKAAALNAGLAHATGDVVVFTDASIALEPDALREVVRPFADGGIGCVSGEDKIADADGEGLYGRYELFLRRRESELHSIVGASGCFYAQRRSLCRPFEEGLAPDFLSVLRTVEQGYRAVSAPRAVGTMTSVKSAKHEFDRKVRTLLRGMTALFAYSHLLNPVRHSVFAFELWSHKLLRWMVPFFLLTALLSSMLLIRRPLFFAAFAAQAMLYLAAAASSIEFTGVRRLLFGRTALFFVSVNAAIVLAWLRYVSGVRQELWTPSQR